MAIHTFNLYNKLIAFFSQRKSHATVVQDLQSLPSRNKDPTFLKGRDQKSHIVAMQNFQRGRSPYINVKENLHIIESVIIDIVLVLLPWLENGWSMNNHFSKNIYNFSFYKKFKKILWFLMNSWYDSIQPVEWLAIRLWFSKQWEWVSLVITLKWKTSPPFTVKGQK